MGIDFTVILSYLLALVLVYIIGRVLLFPIKVIGKFIINGIIGGAILFVLNLVGNPIGLDIGINPLTAIITGVLGVPGVILLVILHLIF